MRLCQTGLSNEQWLLQVGNGTIGQADEDEPENTALIAIPDKYCIPESQTATQELVDFIYDEKTFQRPNTMSLQEKAIVCPKNKTADIINSTVLDMLNGCC